jgi:hypothetical protein
MLTDRQVRQFRSIQRWSRLLPELAAYDDEAACIEDWKKVFRTAGLGWRLFTVIPIAIAAALVGVVLARTVGSRLGLPPAAVTGFFGGLAGGMYPLFAIRIYRRRARRILHDRLRERGIHTCVKCGYLLRGLSEPRCPECGTPFDPNGEATEPRE